MRDGKSPDGWSSGRGCIRAVPGRPAAGYADRRSRSPSSARSPVPARSLIDLVRATGLERPTACRLAVACSSTACSRRRRPVPARQPSLVWARTPPVRTRSSRRHSRSRATRRRDGRRAQLYAAEGDHHACVARPRRTPDAHGPLGAVMPLTKGSGGGCCSRGRTTGIGSTSPAAPSPTFGASVARRAPVSGSRASRCRRRVRRRCGQVLAAISVSGQARRMGTEAVTRSRVAVCAAAALLSVEGGKRTGA